MAYCFNYVTIRKCRGDGGSASCLQGERRPWVHKKNKQTFSSHFSVVFCCIHGFVVVKVGIIKQKLHNNSLQCCCKPAHVLCYAVLGYQILYFLFAVLQPSESMSFLGHCRQSNLFMLSAVKHIQTNYPTPNRLNLCKIVCCGCWCWSQAQM